VKPGLLPPCAVKGTSVRLAPNQWHSHVPVIAASGNDSSRTPSSLEVRDARIAQLEVASGNARRETCGLDSTSTATPYTDHQQSSPWVRRAPVTAGRRAMPDSKGLRCY
jgi:hypothetical protein